MESDLQCKGAQASSQQAKQHRILNADLGFRRRLHGIPSKWGGLRIGPMRSRVKGYESGEENRHRRPKIETFFVVTFWVL